MGHYPEMFASIVQIVKSSCWPYARNGLDYDVAKENRYNFLHGAIVLILGRILLSHDSEIIPDWGVSGDHVTRLKEL